MENPNALIEELDKALEDVGEDIVLRRINGTGNSATNVDVPVRAVVRAVSPDEIVGTITQTASTVILSPTEITLAGWPWGTPSATIDTRVPRSGDKAIIQGRPRNIIFAKPIEVAGELVRIELTVAG